MVTREILRNFPSPHPNFKVYAGVHDYSRSNTLSYEGRVEIEGVRNVLSAIKKKKGGEGGGKKGFNELVIVSVAEGCLDDFVTPLGDFLSVKKEGERLVEEFPSVNSCVVRLGKFDDNFVEEGRELLVGGGGEGGGEGGEVWREMRKEGGKRRKINRRDAARAVVGGVMETEWTGKVVEVWTDGPTLDT
ncbi:hypothetical protein TrRE_jg6664 [Triparma retinervis]|uniref:Uncharacterized protein n=1 Tax=Triparma retinervis TaxID=2557542 RepID=A0A9W6ZLY2_9STRA|nr:hypothetical protein TrRE_jg6664 [Triparma retinervis]